MPKGKKKDVKKKDAKKKDAKKAVGEKSEESVGPTAESSSTTLPDLQNESVNEGEETQAIPEKEPEVEEPPVQPVPQFHEEPILAQVIIKSYEGEQVDGLYEGEGFACFEGGNTYKGMFSEGFMNGQGTYIWADGVKYEGTFVKNVQMLNGCYTWSDGSVYEGSIKDGLRHGFGFFRSGTRPVSYIGDWCNGKRHGKGIIYYDQEHTSWYSGEWVNNVREGWGMRRYRSGNTYKGEWKKNVRHGFGRMTWLTANQEYVGYWEYGIQHGHGAYVWFLKRMPLSQYPLRNEYRGDFVKGERHGHGMFIYADGAVYRGEWVCNKKHGKGIFVFRNGRVFEGEFVDDCPVECPALQGDDVEAEELGAIGTGGHSGTKKNTFFDALEKTSILGSDIELNISSLLQLFSRTDREEEVEQVEFAVLKHITKLRRVYSFYSALGYIDSPDNVFILSKLQFWRFLKDCEFHHSYITLAEMDRLLSGNIPIEDIHCPQSTLLFRTFLSYLVHLAFHIYHEEHKDARPHLHKCFLEMMTRNILPGACYVQGILFSDERCTVFAMNYIDKCQEIYTAFCTPGRKPPFEPTLTMRQFLWMLKDFQLLSKELTVSRLVEIFVKIGASLHDISRINLDLELVFLEFFEALLECALVYVTPDMIPEEVALDNQEGSSFNIKDLSKETSAVSVHSESSLPQPPRPCEDEELSHQHSLLVSETLPSFPASHGDSRDDLSLLNEDVKKEQDSCSAEELTDEAKEDNTEQEEEFSLWMWQVQIFFTTKLFPAYQHEKVLREKIKENQKQDAELAEVRKIQDEELARLIAEKEVEAAKRREAAAAEKALASQSAELEESVTTVTPKEKGRRRLFSKKGAHRKGLSPKRGFLPKKETPKKEPSAKNEAGKAAQPEKKEAEKAAPTGTNTSADKKN